MFFVTKNLGIDTDQILVDSYIVMIISAAILDVILKKKYFMEPYFSKLLVC